MFYPDYYSTGQFMKLTHVSKKTLRYYDEHNILKPSMVSDSGARFYSEQDLAKMQQILLLKYLGFSLSDIREMTIQSSDSTLLDTSLGLQKKLIEDKIEQLSVILKAIDETRTALQEKKGIDWRHMLELIHSTGIEESLKNQYQNANNISSRIHLHTLYAQNKQGWFPWIYEHCQMKDQMKVLEIGCGDGSFWTENLPYLPKNIQITLSDKSEGMLRDAKRRIGTEDKRFSYACFDGEDIPYKENQYDLILANHVLFYCEDIKQACDEIKRVLKTNGIFICSTYGNGHMKEISELVTSFDDRITLSNEKLYEHFGKENGTEILSHYFTNIEWLSYEDALLVSEPAPLISYVLSCHGNQTQYILDRYKEFQGHVKKSIGNGLTITKDAGIFLCSSPK